MTDYELVTDDSPLESLEDTDRKPEIIDHKAVVSESNQQKAYHLRQVKVLEFPIERADVAVDRTEIWLCSCGDFVYRKWPFNDLRPDRKLSKQVDSCKHIRQTVREEKAKVDDSQIELV